MLFEQMDERCALHSKSGTLNNSATSCVTLTAVQLTLKLGTDGKADAPLTANTTLRGEVP